MERAPIPIEYVDHIVEDHDMVELVDHIIYEFGDKNTRGRPPPKIRGSQFVKREEKKRPKLIIRPAWKNNPTKTRP